MKVVAGGLLGGGAGVAILTTAFKPDIPPANKQKKLDFKTADPKWKYHKLDPVVTGNLAYHGYNEGSCMFGIVNSFISQLATKIGEPYSSFPVHMMKYGHGGVGGFGTLCGALNGASSLIGLFVADKGIQNDLIKDLFRWYENTPLPVFKPDTATLDFMPPTSISMSTLCHVSNTRWAETAGHRVKSKQRSERCRRLTADVAARLVTIMNKLADNAYTTESVDDETTRTCVSCHDKPGKLGNTSCKMNCNSCHDKSIGHALFGDVHYKFMDKRE